MKVEVTIYLFNTRIMFCILIASFNIVNYNMLFILNC